eukprot:CAMPEP_0170461760 /NCGR_PEP_ID=MMETSP0123-20130129/7537_1 /TAXON_ID=182087 /ORGANISM="Favella ehrenbergii, Strain Fehren 1" /LENGTH=172 /DNA_ID=CAMNT_0010726845 /DNA_START=755 /DNA_END=1273 /DNA_ORIENTATION=-
MELQEHGHEDSNDSVEHVGDLDDDVRDKLLLVLLATAEVVSVEGPLDGLEPGEGHGNGNEVSHDKHVDQEEDEELAVPEADAVVNPGAVMVHVENAAIARAAVMAPLRLEDVTHEAVAASLVLGVTQVEAPEDGDLPRICRHALNEGPDEHEEDDVKDGKQQHDSPIIFGFG